VRTSDAYRLGANSASSRVVMVDATTDGFRGNRVVTALVMAVDTELNTSAGRRQLSWPVDDNYLGR